MTPGFNKFSEEKKTRWLFQDLAWLFRSSKLITLRYVISSRCCDLNTEWTTWPLMKEQPRNQSFPIFPGQTKVLLSSRFSKFSNGFKGNLSASATLRAVGGTSSRLSKGLFGWSASQQKIDWSSHCQVYQYEWDFICFIYIGIHILNSSRINVWNVRIFTLTRISTWSLFLNLLESGP